MFGRYFGQLVTWLKINYFGESNQLLGPLCLWQCFFVIPYFQYFAPPRHFPQFLLSVPILHLKQTKCKMGSISKYLTPLIHFEMSTLVVVELKLWVGTLSCQDQRARILKLKFAQDFEAEIWSRFWGWCLVDTLVNLWHDLKSITLVRAINS